ncbi:MAG: hypothetical protein QOI83_3662 [Streptomycetaceae bacterium]|nr:hypothetical protein [Streptomycetaceae bacterium]
MRRDNCPVSLNRCFLNEASRSGFCLSERSPAAECAGGSWMAVPAGVDPAGLHVELSHVDAMCVGTPGLLRPPRGRLGGGRRCPCGRAGRAEVFEVTRLVCAQAGWKFERVGTPDVVLLANVWWLWCYRHPRCLHDPAAARLREVFASPGPPMAGADAAGDRPSALPVLLHLL